jgi:hypothetical protein
MNQQWKRESIQYPFSFNTSTYRCDQSVLQLEVAIKLANNVLNMLNLFNSLSKY